MAHHYSLRVNDRFLGPYERRMIVGMRVKNLVADEQQLQRDDGLEMTVAELMQDRLEAKRLPGLIEDTPSEFHGGTPSTGMWLVFLVRFDDVALNAEAKALGIRGEGSISYQGDALHLNIAPGSKQRAPAPQRQRLPITAIESSMTDGAVLELMIKAQHPPNRQAYALPLRLLLASEAQANELWELLNMRPGELPDSLAYAATASAPLLPQDEDSPGGS